MPDPTNVETGTEYEQFVQAVYQAVINAEGIENIKVQHNIQLLGKSGCEHQIDVYLEFRIAGQIYKTAIECKAFNKSVSIGWIRDFYGVLVDVPGLIGVFATLIGYQSGARKYAAHYGISLKELRKPVDADWTGRLKDIYLNIHVVSTEIKRFQPRVSQAYLGTLRPGERIELKDGFLNHEPIIFDRSGDVALSYEDLRQNLPNENKSAVGLSYFAPFPNHILRFSGTDIPIDGIDFVYNVNIETEQVIIRGDELAQAIIKDVISGELKFVDNKGGVRNDR